MDIKKFRRKVGVFGVAIASMFGAPLPMMKKAHEDDTDPGLNVVIEEGIVSSEDIVHGDWFGFREMDERLYIYGSLENLVGDENEVDGKFWKSATLSTDGNGNHTIRGTRNDGSKFSLTRTFDTWDRNRFDALCRDFNAFLKAAVGDEVEV